jgi:hypothetical protein
MSEPPRDADDEDMPEHTLSGWMPESAYVGRETAKGDEILFGEAMDSEDEASRAHGRKGAADDARRLYRRVYELFPGSTLAGEALYRSADIQWQLDKAEVESRPSFKALGAEERPPIDEQEMKRVEKKFAGTRWAELAAYARLENRMCADWAASSKCPEMEAEVFAQYAAAHPGSPRAAEAWYNAAYRWAVALTLYGGEGGAKKVPEAERRAEEAARKCIEKNASAEWNAKAERLLYLLQNKIAVPAGAME